MVYTYHKTADGLYLCQHCGVTKARQNTMHYHLKTHEGKLPFECTICKKQFLHASTLDLHKRAQHADVQEKLFHCPVQGCPYEGTLTKANLLIHYVRRHCADEARAARKPSCEAPTCTHCDKTCNSMTAFHYHVLSCLPLDAARAAHVAQIQAS